MESTYMYFFVLFLFQKIRSVNYAGSKDVKISTNFPGTRFYVDSSIKILKVIWLVSKCSDFTRKFWEYPRKFKRLPTYVLAHAKVKKSIFDPFLGDIGFILNDFQCWFYSQNSRNSTYSLTKSKCGILALKI